jgi:hypothetical protein
MERIYHFQIARMVDLYNRETHPFRKVHRLIDLFETIIKTHTVYIVSDYLRQKNVSKKVKGMLVEGLWVPSLGIWQMFSRELLRENSSTEEGPGFFLPKFDRYFKKWAKPVDSHIIPIRNKYAHGTTPKDEECARDIAEFTPIAEEMLAAAWLQTTAVAVFRKNGDTCELEETKQYASAPFK